MTIISQPALPGLPPPRYGNDGQGPQSRCVCGALTPDGAPLRSTLKGDTMPHYVVALQHTEVIHVWIEAKDAKEARDLAPMLSIVPAACESVSDEWAPPVLMRRVRATEFAEREKSVDRQRAHDAGNPFSISPWR